MSEYEPHDSMYWEKQYLELKSKVRDWSNRIEKATMNVSTHLFKEVIQVKEEMKNAL